MKTVVLYGKENCSKCAVLKRRLAKAAEASDMGFRYCSVSEKDGLVEFCMRGRLNPQRIPAFLIVGEDGDPLLSGDIGDEILARELAPYRLHEWAGLETNYDAGGVITDAMIQAVIGSAR